MSEIINGQPSYAAFYHSLTMHCVFSDASISVPNEIMVRKFTDASLKYSYFSVAIPENFKAGSNAHVVFDGAPNVINNSGTTKIARFGIFYNWIREGVTIPAYSDTGKFDFSVPDSESGSTGHKLSSPALTGLQAGDYLSVKLTRYGNDAEDTWTGEIWVANNLVLRYIADKIGVEL